MLFFLKLQEYPDIHLLHSPDLSILCLRITHPDIPTESLNDLQEYIYENIKKEGKRSISITKLGELAALRFVAVSPSVTTESMLETIETARRLVLRFKKN